VIPLAALMVTAVMMLGEQQRSRANERTLRARGAVEPGGDVYTAMAWAYPGMFVVMTIEGLYAGPRNMSVVVAGAVLFAGAKALKYWAIASLGTRWTFRVLTIPGAPLVSRGPYAFVRHPNYIAVVGEVVGFALLAHAPVTGVIALSGFGLLLWRRISVEERALAG
jgi:methyltransferase